MGCCYWSCCGGYYHRWFVELGLTAAALQEAQELELKSEE